MYRQRNLRFIIKNIMSWLICSKIHDSNHDPYGIMNFDQEFWMHHKLLGMFNYMLNTKRFTYTNTHLI